MEVNNDSGTRPVSDFSIEHILNCAGTTTNTTRSPPSQSCGDYSAQVAHACAGFSRSNSTTDIVAHHSGESYSNNMSHNRYEMPLPAWLQCTRYCPPKIQRNGKQGPVKRQLGRQPRIPFTSYQLGVLEEKFLERPYISSEEVTAIAAALSLTDIRVKIWFQNRRARERRELNTQLVSPTINADPTNI